MSRIPIIQVAKSGKDLNTATANDYALDTRRFLPKIVATKAIDTNDTFTAWSDLNGYANPHGLDYPPNTVCYLNDAENYYADPDMGAYVYRPVSFDVDDTNIYGYSTQFYDPNIEDYAYKSGYALIFIDPLLEPTTYTVAENRGTTPFLMCSGAGVTRSYDHKLDSFYDTLKVMEGGIGTLTLTIPSVTMAADAEQAVYAEFKHGLSYLPVVAPFESLEYFSLNDYYQSDGTTIPTTINLNSLATNWVESAYPRFNSGLVTWEFVDFWFNSEKLRLKFLRYNTTGGSYTAPARTITLNYTVFLNRLDEEFNLLS